MEKEVEIMIQQISESELVLMKIIWNNGGTALYSHIMEELERDSNEWKKNTVLTLLSRLVEKGFLRTAKIGRRNEYKAVVLFCTTEVFENIVSQLPNIIFIRFILTLCRPYLY